MIIQDRPRAEMHAAFLISVCLLCLSCAFRGQVLLGTCAPTGTGQEGACLLCLMGTGVVRHRAVVRSNSSFFVSVVCAFRGQVLSGTDVCCTHPYAGVFREPRSRFPGACGGRGLSDLACLQTAGLYERPSSARVTERVRLPLAIRLGVDKPVHGQRTSIISIPACPHPHTTLPTHQPYMTRPRGALLPNR